MFAWKFFEYKTMSSRTKKFINEIPKKSEFSFQAKNNLSMSRKAK